MNFKPVSESMNGGMIVNQKRAGAWVSLASFQFPRAGEQLHQAVCILVHLRAVCVHTQCQKRQCFFLCDGLCDQLYPTYSAISGMCTQSCYGLDMQTGAVTRKSRGDTPCTSKATRYRFPSQILHYYPTGITLHGCSYNSHKTL